MVKIYKGIEINKDIINKIMFIAKNRYDERIFKEYYGDVKNCIDLADVHGVDASEENIILGSDWFLAYADFADTISILEWVSIQSERNSVIRSMEMKKHLLSFFKENGDKMFEATMRHDTSYQFYKSLSKYGIFEEFFHDVILDVSVPEELTTLINDKYDGDLNKYLVSSDFEKYPEYHKFIMHSLIFTCNYSPKIDRTDTQSLTN